MWSTARSAKKSQGNRSPEMQQVLATRASNGWSSQDIATPNSKAKGIDGGRSARVSVLLARPVARAGGTGRRRREPPLAPGVTQATMYLRDNASGTYLPLVSEANVAPGRELRRPGALQLGHAGPQPRRVPLGRRADGPRRSRPGLYEWSEGQARSSSACCPRGKPAPAAELGYLRTIPRTRSRRRLARGLDDARRRREARRGHLYLRDTARGETVQLDAAQGVAEPEEGSAQFQTASSDGSRVFFTDKQRLTADSTAEPGQGNGKPDLYECEIVEAARQARLPPDRSDGRPRRGRTRGRAGPDVGHERKRHEPSTWSRRACLAGNANGNGETAQTGADNLYELQLRRLAMDAHVHRGVSRARTGRSGKATRLANTAYLTARVSPNGRYLAFMSAAPMTGYDNVDASPAAKGARDEEVYLYDSQTREPAVRLLQPVAAPGLPVCRTRRNPEKDWACSSTVARSGSGTWLAGNIPGWTAESLGARAHCSSLAISQTMGGCTSTAPTTWSPRLRTARRTSTSTSPQASAAARARPAAASSLISGGSSDHESAFLEATPDGSGVFFLTEAQLLPQDTDTAFDIYDARECTRARHV